MPDRPGLTMTPNQSRRSVAIRGLDLLRTRRLDRRAAPRAARFDKPPDDHAAPREALQIKPHGRETALVSFPDRNRKILGPMLSEIHIDRGSALAHGHHAALDQRKLTLMRQHIRGGLGVDQVIIRIGPQAKLGLAGGALP